MTEHSASIFVFFFLAEYGNIVLICVLNTILFLGGYLSLFNTDSIINLLNLGEDFDIFENISSSSNLAIKTSLLIFVFIWVRASIFIKKYALLRRFYLIFILLVLSVFITFKPLNFVSRFSLTTPSLQVNKKDANPNTLLPEKEEGPLRTAPFLVLQVPKKDVNLNITLPIKEEGTLVSIPVKKHYTNLLDKSTLSCIKQDLKLVSGIYAFVHNDSKKLYIGSSCDLTKRINEHLNNRSSNILLQRAFSKHGLKKFSIYILDILNISPEPNFYTAESSAQTLQEFMIELTQLEQKYLCFLNKYNINPAAGSRLGAKHTE